MVKQFKKTNNGQSSILSRIDFGCNKAAERLDLFQPKKKGRWGRLKW